MNSRPVLEGRLLASRYRVQKLLAAGGMGEVYAAVQEDLHRKVALKVLHRSKSITENDLSRFRAEALAAAELGHPNIVQVTDFQAPPNEPAILVMEQLEGESLRELLNRERKLAPARAAFIATQMLAALGAAHAAGIIHRDIKPANVFLVRTPAVSDLVKVLDFGIAKVPRLAEGFVTSPGAILGTPAYMAPEQALGIDLDHRVDLYAVGVCLFEMLAGRRPHLGTTSGEILEQITRERPPPLASIAPELDPRFAAVVDRALARDPHGRPANALAMLEMLAPWSRSDSTLGGSPDLATAEGASGGEQGGRGSTAVMRPLATGIGDRSLSPTVSVRRSSAPAPAPGAVTPTGTSLLPPIAPTPRTSAPAPAPGQGPHPSQPSHPSGSFPPPAAASGSVATAPVASLPARSRDRVWLWALCIGLGFAAPFAGSILYFYHQLKSLPRIPSSPTPTVQANPLLDSDYWMFDPLERPAVGKFIGDETDDFAISILFVNRDMEHRVAVFDGRTRALAWSAPIGKPGNAISHRLASVGQRIAVITDGALVRIFDAEAGRELRSASFPTTARQLCVPSSSGTDKSGRTPAPSRTEVWVETWEKSSSYLDVETGALRPQPTPPPGCFPVGHISPIHSNGGRAPASDLRTEEGRVTALLEKDIAVGQLSDHLDTHPIVGVSLPKKKILWRTPGRLRAIRFPVLELLDGRVWIVRQVDGGGSTAECLDARTGEKHWSIPLGAGEVDAYGATLVNGRAYLNTAAGLLVVDDATGSELGRVKASR